MRDPADLSRLSQNLKPNLKLLRQIAERVAKHFKNGAFEFDFSTEEMIDVEGNTVYRHPSLRGGRGEKCTG